MVIEEVIGELWKEQYQEYREEMDKVDAYTAEELFNLCKADIIELDEKPYCTDMHTLSIMETIGCQHQIKCNKISGCSFCNWDSSRVKQIAHLAKMCEKDVNLYAEAIKFSFQQIRGQKCKPSLIEQMSVHDILNEKQYPKEAFQIMFENCSVYESIPQMGIISARADSVTAEKIRRWKKFFKRSLTVGIGIECGNEFVRNHWLNKNLTNQTIKNAVTCIKNEGGKVCANILLGIPGLSENVSLPLFLDTCQFIFEDLDVEYVLISPLINKENTLGYLLNGETSTISTQLLINAIRALEKHFQKYLSRITFSPDNLENMKKLTSGKELKKLQELYDLIGNMGTVYTTTVDMADGLRQLSYVKKIKIARSESLKEELKLCMHEVGDKLHCEKSVDIQFQEELLQLRTEELKWKHWSY